MEKSPPYGVVVDCGVELMFHGTDEPSNSSVALLKDQAIICTVFTSLSTKYWYYILVDCPVKKKSGNPNYFAMSVMPKQYVFCAPNLPNIEIFFCKQLNC